MAVTCCDLMLNQGHGCWKGGGGRYVRLTLIGFREEMLLDQPYEDCGEWDDFRATLPVIL